MSDADDDEPKAPVRSGPGTLGGSTGGNADDDEPKAPVRYFGLDPRKLSLAEYWRAPQRGSFVAGLVIKALPVKVDVPRAVPLTEELIELDPDDLPRAGLRLRPAVAELERLGFELAFYYREDIVQPHGEQAAAVLLAPDGRTYASALFASARIGDQWVEDLRSVFVSRLDRRIVVTSNKPGEMDAPPEIDGEVVHGTLADAYARHRERIAGGEHDTYRGSPAAAVFERDELRRFVIALSRRVVEHGVARGVFTPMPPDQVTALRRGQPGAVAKPPSPAATLLVWLGVALLLAILFLL
jgi:hypothetical protein